MGHLSSTASKYRVPSIGIISFSIMNPHKANGFELEPVTPMHLQSHAGGGG
jgi:hypothetical protein